MKNLTNISPSRLSPRTTGTIAFVDAQDIYKKKVLDIGCGYGWFINYALKKGASRIVGTEISAGDFKTARKYLKDKRVSFEVAGATKLPFKNNSFDTVVCWEVIEHIPQNTENKMFQEIRRVLKKNGKLYISTPLDSWPSKFFDPAYWLVGHRHYSEKQFINYAKQNHLKILKVGFKGNWWSIIASVDMYFSKWVFRRKPLFEKLINKKVLDEYLKDDGVKNIYIKFCK